MAILPIVTVPHPVLRKKSQNVTLFDDELRKFASDMIETMYDAHGAGLAAVQVGVLKRIIVMDLSCSMQDGYDTSIFPFVAINPEIISKSETTCFMREGCLSVPGEYLDLERPSDITLRYNDLHGNLKEIECSDWFARCVLHEIDHLNGRLLIDDLSHLKKEMIIKKVIKHETKRQES